MNHQEAADMLRSPYAQVRDLAAWAIAAHEMLAEIKDGVRREQEREFACDIECEKSMLATVWLAQDAATLLRLDGDDFLDAFNRWLYGHLRGLVEAGEPLDMVALLRRLKQPEAFAGLDDRQREGHRADVAALLIGSHGSSAHVDYYFRTLRSERLRRAAGRLADAIRERAEKLQQDPAAVLGWAGEQIEKLKRVAECV